MKAQLLRFLASIVLVALVSSCTNKGEGFSLFQKGIVANIYVSQTEAVQIRRAAIDLQNDIEKVTGVKPQIINSLEDASEYVIVIGSINDAVIKELQSQRKLNELGGSENMHEAFLLKAVASPTKSIKNALVVAGSDANGTVFGIYEISERIGVSPLNWWCDVVPEKKNEVVLQNCLMLPREPSVKYRGIFINDEEAMTQWSELTSPNEYNVHPSPEVYKRVFELLLRLKANAIWPGMMQRSSYFFEAKDENGVPVNPKTATEYGIYVGSSHCENMARNNWDEWHGWAKAHVDMYDAKGEPLWDYTVNPKAIEAYWQERLDESKDYNMIYTLGIRGVHDSPFLYENMENPTLKKKVELLQKVIDRQREMIKETFGSEDAVPQVFVPYEEAAELYNGESTDGKEKCKGIELPEDVMMVWTEDNFGYARQLPTDKEKKRPGGNGLYYHLAYQGWPTTYDWLTTTPLPVVQNELRKVYDNDVNKIWMVNVGDVKPAEMSLQFFMSLAYNINSYGINETKKFLQKSATQQFKVDDELAQEVADLINDFNSLTWPKKPEPLAPLWAWNYEKDWLYRYYSFSDFGDEAQRQVNKAIELESKSLVIYESLDDDEQKPFWHLVYYPVRSTRLMLEKMMYYRKNVAYARQGRYASVNAYKSLSEQAEAAIQADLTYYREMENGKWNGIMDPYAEYNFKERIFDVANIPNDLIYDEVFTEEAANGIGSVCEGQKLGSEEIMLYFSSFEDNKRFVDIFNKELEANNWTIETEQNWLQFSKTSGEVKTEVRILVSVDWNNIPAGDNKGTFTVKDEKGNAKTYSVAATMYDFELKEKSYAEGAGYVAIEAENYTAKNNSDARWIEYVNFGYSGSSMFLKGGGKVEANIQENAARLEYSVYFATAGTHYSELYRIPTLNEGKGKTVQIAVGLNDNEPQVLCGVRKKKQYKSVTLSDGSKHSWRWENNVLMQMERIPFEITVDKPGYHTLKVYQVNTEIGIDKIVICTNKQAKLAQQDALVGALESYNTIAPYKSIEPAVLPIIDGLAEITPYRAQPALTNANLNFAFYAMLEAFDFIPVNQRHVYHPNKNQFGWRAQDVNFIGSEHNESTERLPFWQRDGLRGTKEAKFYVKLENGTYNITYYMGDARLKEEMVYSKGKNYLMSFAINGQQLMNNEDVITGKQKIETVEITISDEELLELTLSGKWIINALEIKRRKSDKNIVVEYKA